MSNSWVNVMSLATLREAGSVVVRKSGKQIALFFHHGTVFACNNRCPHEGFPLSEGTLDKQCVITCNWHNWKFNLINGENLYRGEKLRVYPVEIRDGDVWLNLSDPLPENRRVTILDGLRSAFDVHDYERLAREISRWQKAEGDPVDIIKQAISWTFDRLEFGWTHAYAGAADWLTLYDEYAGDRESQLICILEAVGHIAFDALREPHHPFSAVTPRPYEEAAFLSAIEDENEDYAIALVRGALSSGLEFEHLEPALTKAALNHYNDFGHCLIYVNKARTLIERLGEEVAEPLLMSLTRSLVYATREDLIPEFRQYAQAIGQWGQDAEGELPEPQEIRRLSINKVLNRTVLASNHPPPRLFQSLLGANALSMLGFDIDYQYLIDAPVSSNVGWLDFTHSITFADAVWKNCHRYPVTWPGALLQLACFIGRNASFTQRELNGASWHVDNVDQFFSQEVERLFDHAREDYIVSVHLLKTLLAARSLVSSGASGASAPADQLLDPAYS